MVGTTSCSCLVPHWVLHLASVWCYIAWVTSAVLPGLHSLLCWLLGSTPVWAHWFGDICCIAWATLGLLCELHLVASWATLLVTLPFGLWLVWAAVTCRWYPHYQWGKTTLALGLWLLAYHHNRWAAICASAIVKSVRWWPELLLHIFVFAVAAVCSTRGLQVLYPWEFVGCKFSCGL